MSPPRGAVLAAALACAAAAAGCGLGAGDTEGEAELTVTRDYGAVVLAEAGPEVRGSDTVIRLLDDNAEVGTRYGGRFVQSIDGLSGGQRRGRLYDWFYFVNGIEAPRGAADFGVAVGDRIWWDNRDWTEAMRTPAVVGSWPEPFAHGFDGERWPADVRCSRSPDACAETRRRLEGAGAEMAGPDAGGAADGVARVLVGPWAEIRRDAVAVLLDRGPATSGVFAHFVAGPPEGWSLLVEDAAGDPARRLGAGAGLVAALRPGEGPPTWLVTGTDDAGVEAAAAALEAASLRNRYAVAVAAGGRALRVPAPPAGGAG